MKPSDVFPAPARAFLGRCRALMGRLADLWPVSALGMALLLVAAVSLQRFGFAKLDLVLLVVGYGAAALLVVAISAVALTALVHWILLRRANVQSPAARLETGVPSATGFSLPHWWWFPLVQVRWSWVAPAGASVAQEALRGRLVEQVTLGCRGIVTTVERRIVIQDAFGLARVAFLHRQPRSFEVLPHVGGLRRLPVLTSLAGGEEHPHPMGLEDGDRVELRRYVPGDSARFIHWKVFGRTRRLMVRVPERALSRARRTVAYLVAGSADEAAAAAARAAVDEDALGVDWAFGADGAPGATSDRAEARVKIMRSGGFSGASGSGLRPFLAEVDPAGPAALVVFVPPTAGGWIDEVRAVAARRPGRVRVVVAIDAVHEAHPGSRWRRWLMRPERVAGVARADLERVGQALARIRCEVVIIDRVSGRIVGDGTRVSLPLGRAA